MDALELLTLGTHRLHGSRRANVTISLGFVALIIVVAAIVFLVLGAAFLIAALLIMVGFGIIYVVRSLPGYIIGGIVIVLGAAEFLLVQLSGTLAL